jgi:hypothetical protein
MLAMHVRRLALTLLLTLAAPAALAQWSPPPTMDLGLGTAPIGIDPSLLSPVPRSAAAARAELSIGVSRPQSPQRKAYCARHVADAACRRAARSTAQAVAPPRAPDLVFKRSPAVSNKVVLEIASDLARRNPELYRPELQTNLILANAKGQFDALLRLHGRSPANLGDVMGTYLALSWESYAGGVASPAEVSALSSQWRRDLRRSALATQPDARKQALAETLAWRAMLAAGATRNARAQAAPQLAQLREGVRMEVLQATGIDLARTRITEHGFEPALLATASTAP